MKKEPITIPPELAHLSTQELADRLGCSRQYIGKLKRRMAGLCMQCTKPATVGALCKKHATKRRKLQRDKYQLKPWRPGKRGRPPLDRKDP